MAMDWQGTLLGVGKATLAIVGIAFLVGIVFLFMWYMKKMKVYKKYRVIVYKRFKDKNGAELAMYEDFNERGGAVFDKKIQKWVFHLKKANVDIGEEESLQMDENRELDLPTIPGPRGEEVLFVEKIGNRKYAIGNPTFFEGKVSVMVSEADLAEAKRSYAVFVQTYGKKQNPFLAFVIYMVFAVLALILIYIVYDKIGVIAKALETASINFKTAYLGAGGDAVVSSAPG